MQTLPAVTWLLEINADFTDPETLAAQVAVARQMPAFHPRFEAWPQVNGPQVAYGTLRCLSSMLRQPGIANAVFDDYQQLQCSSYYSYLYAYLRRRSFLLPLACLPQIDLSDWFGSAVFIRPNSNKKPFEAEVVSTSGLARFREKYAAFDPELVVVSEVISIEREFRCFCRNGEVFCHSSYLEDEYLPVPARVQEMAAEIATLTWQQSGMNMITVDLAATAKGLALIEIGGVNSWGIYGANVQDFIAGMEAEARERHADLWG